MPFDDYRQTPDGLYEFQKPDGSWTPGMLPTGYTMEEAARVDLARRDRMALEEAAGGGPAQPPSAPLLPMDTPAPVQADPNAVAQIAALREAERARRLAEGEYSSAPPPVLQSDAGKSVEPAAGPPPEPAGYSGRSEAPQMSVAPPLRQGVPVDAQGNPQPYVQDAAGQPVFVGPPALPTEKPIMKGDGATGGGSPSEQDKATAAELYRHAAIKALRGSPGVYDPGGERLQGYTTQRQALSSTEALRMADRAKAAGIPPELLPRMIDRARGLGAELNALGAAYKQEKNPARRAALEAKMAPLLREQQRIGTVLAPMRDALPGDLEALRDVEGAEANVRRIGEDELNVSAREAQERVDAAKEAEAMRARNAEESKAFHEKRKAALQGVYDRMQSKREEYADAKVDPQKIWGDIGTANTVAASVFVALSAFANGITGRNDPNGALNEIKSAVDRSIDLQIRNIDKKGKELGHLAQEYEFAKDKLGSEEAGILAAQASAMDVIKAKLDRTAAEAADQKVALAAQRLSAEVDREQKLRRLALEQASIGTRAEQVRVDQAGWRGGSAGDPKKAAELFAKAGELGDADERQQVQFEGKKYALGKFVEKGEGKEAREFFGILTNAQAEAKALQQMSVYEKSMSPTDKATFESRKKRLGENMSKLQKMGVLQRWDDEESGKIYGSLMGGKNVMDDAERFLGRMGNIYLDQYGAKPISAGTPKPWEIPGYTTPGKLSPGPAGTSSAPAKKGGGSLPKAKSLPKK